MSEKDQLQPMIAEVAQVMLRPALSDPWVARAVAEELWEGLCEDDAELAAHEDPAGCVGDIEEAVKHGDLDGYSIAKELDAAGWEGIDAAMVARLDRAHHIRSRLVRSAIERWVVEAGKCLDLQVGTTVRVPTHSPPHFRRALTEGIVCALHPQTWQYSVRCAALGHLSEDDARAGKTGTLSLYVNAEDVEVPL